MIVTRKYLEEFIDISEISTQELCKTLNSIGLEVDSVNSINIPKKVVVGKVLDKQKHPDADKLNICQVDIGGVVNQIVCGAKNVDKGQYVAVATLGCDLGGGFIIKKAKLRGAESNGMICSSSELGLAKLNDGIMVLDNSIGELELGKALCEYEIFNDDIIEIELTANRGDCLSVYGVAREFSAYYNIPIKREINSIKYNNTSISQLLDISCEGDNDSSLIYKIVDLKDFKTPLKLDLRVATIGKYEENSTILNILNYATHLTGVIFNAYLLEDLEKNEGLSSINIKKDKQGIDTVFSLSKQISKVGIEHQKIVDKKAAYLIEASYINPELVSKLVFETKSKTSDVFYRSSRGSEPKIEEGLEIFSQILSKNGAEFVSGKEQFVDDIEQDSLKVDVRKINSIIGDKIETNRIKSILNSLNFELKQMDNNCFSVKIPTYRHDIKNIADITEEIVRIVGIDNIKPKPLLMSEECRENKTSLDILKQNKIRYKAVANGFYETLTYVFTSKQKLEKYGFPTVKEDLDILNPIAKELDTFRTTLLLNLVEACSNNYKNGNKASAFFELGTLFDANRVESKKLAFIQTGAASFEGIENAGKPKNIDFFSFSKKIANIIGKFELEPMSSIENSFVHPYQNANIIVDGKAVGFIAKLHPSVCEDYGLEDTFISQIDFEMIKNESVKVESYSKFQASKKDLSLVVPKSIEYKSIKNAINSLESKRIKQFNIIDVYSDEKLGDSESITIRFILQDDDKTLSEEDITSTMNSILEVLEKNLDISLR